MLLSLISYFIFTFSLLNYILKSASVSEGSVCVLVSSLCSSTSVKFNCSKSLCLFIMCEFRYFLDPAEKSQTSHMKVFLFSIELILFGLTEFCFISRNSFLLLSFLLCAEGLGFLALLISMTGFIFLVSRQKEKEVPRLREKENACPLDVTIWQKARNCTLG